MTAEDDARYRALIARDPRFDGLFFVGVRTTGIYCRPICTAKTPGRERCRFFASAALAEQAGFRPCLRCRPESAPGHAPVDSVGAVARIAAARIEAGAFSDGARLEDLAASLGLSSRQLRRSMRKELGVSPVELAQTNRSLLAKRLIAETRLSMAEIAFASGFASVRRFNHVFRERYRLTPTDLRRSSKEVAPDRLRLTLAFRPPMDWNAMLRFLAARAVPGVESVADDVYHRTIAIGDRRGWLSVSRVLERNVLSVDLSASLAPVLPSVLARLRNLFDLDARPDVIADHLRLDPLLAPHVARQPGLRVPGAFDSFELAVRAILGQQVSVRAASTLAGRLAERFGEPIETPLPGLNRIACSAEALAQARVATLGLPKARAETLRNFARVVSRRELDLDASVDPSQSIARLQEIPGIGPWTTEYIAMRGLRSPDAFPAGDLGLRKASSATSARELEERAECWRPWRAYGAMHLWESLGAPSIRTPSTSSRSGHA